MKILHATLLDEIVRRIVTALQPETIYLYGSHAYGQRPEPSAAEQAAAAAERTRTTGVRYPDLPDGRPQYGVRVTDPDKGQPEGGPKE